MRADFNQKLINGKWAENSMRIALNNTKKFFAIGYGPSEVREDLPIEQQKLRKELIKESSNGLRRPDLLVFHKKHENKVIKIIESLPKDWDITDEMFLIPLLKLAIWAAEIKFSQYIVEMMKDWGTSLREQPRLKKFNLGLGLPKDAKIPHIFLKKQDKDGLLAWQNEHNIPVHVWQVFLDHCFGVSLKSFCDFSDKNILRQTTQNGLSDSFQTYDCPYYLGYKQATMKEKPIIESEIITQRTGRVETALIVKDGRFKVNEVAINW